MGKKRNRITDGDTSLLNKLMEAEAEHFEQMPEDAEAMSRVELFLMGAKAVLRDHGIPHQGADVVKVAELMLIESGTLLDDGDDGESVTEGSADNAEKRKSKKH